MDLGISGRTAFVGGSSSGLGRAAAEALAAEGCRLILCARRAEVLEEVAAGLRERHAIEVVTAAGDLSDGASIGELIELATSEAGPIDILVTNVGGPPSGLFDDLDQEAWSSAIALLLESVLHLCRAVLPGMRQRGWGRIVNITSVAVKQPVDGLILSNSIRAAVTGLARTLANEVSADGVTVNNVMPGYTRTERLNELAEAVAARSGGSPADVFASWEGETPAGRLGEPAELASVIAFLASERASYVTGTSIAVDGGWIRGLL